MGKRAASRIHIGLSRGCQAIRTATQKLLTVSAQLNQRTVAPHESLESRVLLSATPAVVHVSWNGHDVQAYQYQYIAETEHPTLLQNLAKKESFTGLTSLGGPFYQFSSNLSIAKLQKLSDKDVLTFKALGPNEIQHINSTAPNDVSYPLEYHLNNAGQVEPFDYENNGIVTPYNYQQAPPATIAFPSPPYPNDNKVGTVGDDIGAQQAWDITTGSSSVVVAVLDTGIDTTHPDLIPNLWTNPLDTVANNEDGDGFAGDIHGWSFVNSSPDVTDLNGHGTNVAGIIGAAGNNGIGVAGVNWNVQLLPVQVSDASGAGSDATIIAGINYVTLLKNHGINIVAMNESLGDSTVPIDVLSSDAIKLATKAGILDVVAAGNSSQNLDSTVTSPAKLSLSNPDVITVAAVDNQFQLAAFSNFGATSVDLAAPGIDIYSTSPTYPVTLNSAVAATPDLPQFPLNYGYLSGTSQAAPIVTGIIALEAAANPTASPAELKAALLNGVTYDPALAASNGLPAKVLTSGVANAYKAVLNVLNYSTNTDTSRQGSWSGFYGSQGAYVVGESTSFPSIANVTLDGQSPIIVDNDTRNLAALQRVSDTSSRISAYDASASSESINISFTDGLSHQVELYLADLDHQRRVETVNLIDGASGLVLSSQTVSNFSKGEYLNYNLKGPVTLQIVRDSGPSAVFSGLFFDASPTKPTTYVGTDTSTTGYNWRSQYGSQGALVVGNSTELPAYVTNLSVTGETVKVLHANTRAPNSLQKVTDVNSGIEAYWSTTSQMDIDLSTNDGLLHTVSLYLADYNNRRRTERIEVFDASTGNLLVTQDVNNFKAGRFVSFNITGSVIFRVIRTGGTDAVVSGVFLDAPYGEYSHFIGTDTKTRGNWPITQYGLTDAYVVGQNFPGADLANNGTISVAGAAEKVLAVPTFNQTALLEPVTDSNIRIASYLFTTTGMTLEFNPGDSSAHQLALYFADYENYHRTEVVTITSPGTQTVLSRQTVSNFHKGKYLLYDITGPVFITINSQSYPNAVLSGLFVD